MAEPNVPAVVKTDDQEPKPDYTVARDGLRHLRRLLGDPGNIINGPGVLSWWHAAWPLAIPIVLVALVALVAAEPVPAFLPGAPVGIPGLESLIEPLQANRCSDAALAAAGDLPATTSDEEKAALQSLLADCHALYRSWLQLVLVAATFAVLSLGVAISSRRMLSRHCEPFWPENKGAHKGQRGPILPLAATALIYAMIAIAVLALAPRVFPWALDVLPGFASLEHAAFSELSASDVTAAAAFVVLFTLFFLTLHIVTYAARLISHHYPAPDHVDEVRRKLVTPKAPDAAELRASYHPIGSDLYREARPDEAYETAVAAWMDDTDDDAQRKPRNACDWGLTPEQLLQMLDWLIVPVILVMILALAVLSLVFDLIEAQVALPETLATAQDATHQTWLVGLGVAFSLTLAAIYAPAYIRLKPFAQAAADLEDADKAAEPDKSDATQAEDAPAPYWIALAHGPGGGLTGLAPFTKIKVERITPEVPERSEQEKKAAKEKAKQEKREQDIKDYKLRNLTLYLGANRNKFRIR